MDLAREADPGARIAATLEGMPAASALLLPIGYSRDDDDLSLDAAAIGQLLAANLHAPLAIVHALLPRIVASHGVVVLFGSVAATRGRGRNVVYAGAKRALVSLYESLRQRHRNSELRVQLYELGFMATNLTYGMKLPLPAVDPDVVARIVVRRLRSGSSRQSRAATVGVRCDARARDAVVRLSAHEGLIGGRVGVCREVALTLALSRKRERGKQKAETRRAPEGARRAPHNLGQVRIATAPTPRAGCPSSRSGRRASRTSALT